MLVVGGTKAGMPPTEAVVIFDRALARRFDARLKQAGQLPSKGRFYAAPFIGMLEDGALVRHAAHANAMARRLAGAMPFTVLPPGRGQRRLRRDGRADAWRALHAAGWFVYRFLDGTVRFMCSWATTAGGRRRDRRGPAQRSKTVRAEPPAESDRHHECVQAWESLPWKGDVWRQ